MVVCGHKSSKETNKNQNGKVKKQVTHTADASEGVDQCVEDIDRADFVAMRLDTSDLPKDQPQTQQHAGREVGLQDFYQELAKQMRPRCVKRAIKAVSEKSEVEQEEVVQRLPTRLGLCCAWWAPDAGRWELRSHEISLWPGPTLAVDLQTQCRRLRAATKEEARRKQQSPRQKTSLWSSQLAASARWAVAALQSSRAPVVFYDGAGDLMHIFDKCEGEMPEVHTDLGFSWLQRFRVCFDTRVLAADTNAVPTENATGNSDVLAPLVPVSPASPASAEASSSSYSGGPVAGVKKMNTPPSKSPFAPEELRRGLMRLLGDDVSVLPRIQELGLFTRRASSERLGLVGGGGFGAAARKAMVIAELFILQIRQRVREGRQNVGTEPCRPDARADVTPGRKSDIFNPSTVSTPAPLPSKRKSTREEGASAPKRRRLLPDSLIIAEASACASGLEVFCRKLEKGMQLRQSEAGPATSSEHGDKSPDSPAQPLFQVCLETCRKFQNRIFASGTRFGHWRLDSAVQLRLMQKIRRNQADDEVCRIARILWPVANAMTTNLTASSPLLAEKTEAEETKAGLAGEVLESASPEALTPRLSQVDVNLSASPQCTSTAFDASPVCCPFPVAELWDQNTSCKSVAPTADTCPLSQRRREVRTDAN